MSSQIDETTAEVRSQKNHDELYLEYLNRTFGSTSMLVIGFVIAVFTTLFLLYVSFVGTAMFAMKEGQTKKTSSRSIAGIPVNGTVIISPAH